MSALADRILLSLHPIPVTVLGGSSCLAAPYRPAAPGEESALLLITYLPCADMAALALGTGPAAAVRALQAGKPVYVLNSGLEYRRYNRCADGLLHLYRTYHNSLAANGVKCINEISEIKNLITLRRLQGLADTQVYGGCVTPLAAEYAQAHHIQIIRGDTT